MVQLPHFVSSWTKAGIAQASYADSDVSSSLVARLLIDTMSRALSQLWRPRCGLDCRDPFAA